ncbi:enoyl-CoA hydratase/carnithine racemase [Bradyrhizobium sp. GM24.11]
MSDRRLIVSERKGSVFYITLNRPESLNAINLEMQRGLLDALKAFRDDDQSLVAIVTGEGGGARFQPDGISKRLRNMTRRARKRGPTSCRDLLSWESGSPSLRQ